MSIARWRQGLLISVLLPCCWLAMMAVHEGGHVLGAWAGGGVVERVELHPLAISRTVMRENPHALLEIWCGPLFGALLPVLIAAAWWWGRLPAAHLPRFFAGFCLVANGTYLIAGAVTGDGDAGELLGLGVPAWGLAVAGAPLVVAGLVAWHRLGAEFGFGNGGERVTWSQVAIVACLLTAIVSLELGFFTSI